METDMTDDLRDHTIDSIGISPAQYHVGLDKLWAALGLAGPQDKDVFTLAAEAIIAARPVKETIYYRKVGGHSKRITRLNVDLTPTHDYVEVQSWKVAREILVKLHGTDKVFESSDMFKVLK
jgi:hypothetical protein